MTASLAADARGSARLSMASTWVVALLLPIGPAAVAVLRFILPYYTADTSTDIVAAVSQHPGRESAVLWLGYVAVLTLVPGVFAAARLSWAQAPRLTTWALALSVPGYLSLGVFLAFDQLLWSSSRAGLTAHDSAALVTAAHPTIDISVGVFVIGHVVGTVLLGIALLRSGRIPAWAAWAVTVSQPLHFIATVVLGSPLLDLIGWSLTAVGMVMVARALLTEAATQLPTDSPRVVVHDAA